MAPHALLRSARLQAGLTQAELAARAGTTQSAVARLERPGANPRVETLAAFLAAAGRDLQLSAGDLPGGHDAAQLAELQRLSPRERLDRHRAALRSVRGLARAAQPRHA